MKMKRIVSTLMAGIMVLSLAACGSSGTSGASTEKSEVKGSSKDPITLNMW